MSKVKTAIILMNVGSPDAPTKKSVKSFLRAFLNDKRVIDLPWLLRKFLVNLIIIPFRIKKSTQLYKRIFNKRGSPLLYHSQELKNKLQKILGMDFQVFLGMRYGKLNYREALAEIKNNDFNKIIIIPLFPQYAMSTTETAVTAAMYEVKRLKIDAQIKIVEQFYNHPGFVNAFAEQARKYNPQNYDHVLFSYHGLPNRHIQKSHPEKSVEFCNCKVVIPEHGKLCYKATCHATSRLIAKELRLETSDYTEAFQSRLSKNWLSPFTDEVILQKLKEGHKNILVLAPSFVTDCLETIIEIEQDYNKLFTENGGNKLQLVASLNASDLWVETLSDIITKVNI